MRQQVTKNGSLLTTAFEILLRQLGAQKTNRLWQILTPSKIDYMKVRQELFKGKDVEILYKEAAEFNASSPQ